MDKNREPDKIDENGDQFWYDDNGEWHNDNGFPAIIFSSGTKYWLKHGKWHNEFGPAQIFSDGGKCWYIDGVQLSEQQFKQHKIKNFINEE